MTQKNNILLIVKQQPGIEYNSLLNKISSSYGSINSARAALSRAIKDLSALGMLKKQNNALFVTEKGSAEINREMKNKLLIKLNQSVKGKNPVGEINSIVEMLSTLIERSKADRDLLKAAKGSTEFYLSDLVEIKKDLDKRIKNLNYLSEVLLNQISSLQELNFHESKRFSLNSKSKSILRKIIKENSRKEISVEFSNAELLEKAKKQFKLKPHGKTLIIEKSLFPKTLLFIEKHSKQERNPATIYLSSLKIRIDYPYIYFIGPFKQLKKLIKEKE